MATRRRNGSGGRPGRTGGRSRRPSSTRGNSSGIVWLEVGGAAVLAIVLIVAFSGKKGSVPPRTNAPASSPVKAETPNYKYTPPARTPSYDYLKKAGKKPDRPAPPVDLSKGKQLYQEANRLWNQALKERRNRDGGAKARATLRKAYRLLEEALNSVDDFNMWVEEAELNDWEIDGKTMKAKREVDRWLKLQSRIHKILPEAGK